MPFETLPTFSNIDAKSSSMDMKVVKNGSDDNSNDQDGEEGLIHVEDGFYAIDKVVGWKMAGRKRLYKIRFVGGSETWLPPSNLCEDTLKEAYAFVKADRARQRQLGQASNETSPPNHVAVPKQPPRKKQKKPAASSKASVARNVGSTIDIPEDDDHQFVETKDSGALGAVKNSPKSRKKTKNQKKTPEVVPAINHVDFLDVGNQMLGESKKAAARVDDDRDGKPKAKRKRSQSNKRRDADDLNPVLNREEWEKRELTRGNDFSLVEFQPVKRIDINGENVKERVKEARISGIPVVLTGHGCWPVFAVEFLKNVKQGHKVDLSQPHEIDIDRLVSIIGKEVVPVVEKNYSERDPTRNSMKASTFVKKYWPGSPDYRSSREKLYMQQWQFWNSESVKAALSGSRDCCHPPVEAFSEDLLKFWLNEGGNPYQYLFMGDSETFTKLHRDPGGLDILIAPIVGEKECILAHRSEQDVLYNLSSKLDRIDLLQFPDTALARVWKTIIKPGEILVMPYDTFHQCRNVTPCLSYHRLHLDVNNLRGFRDSLYSGNAVELEHTETLWNICQSLSDRLDEYVELYRAKGQADPDAAEEWSMEETVKTLRLLRSICIGIKQVQEGPGAHRYDWLKYLPKDWLDMIRSIDSSLHEFRHRHDDRAPRLRFSSLGLSTEKLTGGGNGVSGDYSDEEEKTEYQGKFHLEPTLQALEDLMGELPYLKQGEGDLIVSEKIALQKADQVHLRLNNRRARAIVEEVADKKALLVTYDDLPSSFDEYKLFDQVRGYTNATSDTIPTALRPTLGNEAAGPQEVRCVQSDTPTQPRKAKVISSRTGTFYLVRIPLDDKSILRWVARDSIIRKRYKR